MENGIGLMIFSTQIYEMTGKNGGDGSMGFSPSGQCVHLKQFIILKKHNFSGFKFFKATDFIQKHLFQIPK